MMKNMKKNLKIFFDKLLFNTRKIIKFYMDNIKNFNLQFDENNIDDLINIFSYLDDFVSAISESNSNTNESYEKIRLNKNNTFLNTFKHT